MEVIENCVHIFNWETYVVCPASLPHKETNCVYNDTQTLTHYDLTPLKRAGVQKVSYSWIPLKVVLKKKKKKKKKGIISPSIIYSSVKSFICIPFTLTLGESLLLDCGLEVT